MSTNNIGRRRLGRQAVGGLAATAAATTLATPAVSQGRIEWRMVTSWPKLFPGGGTMVERFAKTISDATNGRLSIRVGRVPRRGVGAVGKSPAVATATSLA